MKNKFLTLLTLSACLSFAQTATINGQRANFRVLVGSAAPSSGTCDAASERGSIYLRTGDQASVPSQMYVCKQSGASTYGWGPAGWVAQASAPATCVVGDLYFDTDATAGENLNLCTATNTWTTVSGGGGSGTVNPGTGGCLAYYPATAAAVDDGACALRWTGTTLEIDGAVETLGTPGPAVVTEIAAPGAHATSGKANTYIDSTSHLSCIHVNGQAANCAPFGNSSGEATKAPAAVYGAGWNGSNEPAAKNDVYDKIETISAGAEFNPLDFRNPFFAYRALENARYDSNAPLRYASGCSGGTGAGTTGGTTVSLTSWQFYATAGTTSDNCWLMYPSSVNGSYGFGITDVFSGGSPKRFQIKAVFKLQDRNGDAMLAVTEQPTDGGSGWQYNSFGCIARKTDTNWQAYVSNAGSVTYADTGVAVTSGTGDSDGAVQLEVNNGTGPTANAITCKVNGTSATASATIPSMTPSIIFGEEQNGATLTTWAYSWFGWRFWGIGSVE
jgi:hypothetical protein